MIEYINLRCNQWAQWVRRKEDNGLGFPCECSYTRLQGRVGGQGYLPGIDEAAWEIEQAYQSLEPRLKSVIYEFYLRGGTIEQKAKACGCHRDTFYDRLHIAHTRIMKWLNDYAAGLVERSTAKSTCAMPTIPV